MPKFGTQSHDVIIETPVLKMFYNQFIWAYNNYQVVSEIALLAMN